MPDIPSETINHVQYDRDSRVLIVKFRETGVFRYFDVPEDLYLDMLSAEDPEDYYNANIYGRFRHMPQDAE